MNLIRNKGLEKSITELMLPELRTEHAVFCYEEVDSVLDVAKEIARSGTCQKTLIIAKSQSAGRGQQGRSWVAVEEAFLGCLLFPATNIAKPALPAFSLVVALQIARIIMSYGGEVGLKWPNDILTKKNIKKISGILLETDLKVGEDSSPLSLRVGVGVNLIGSPEEGSSIQKEIGKSIPLAQFSAQVFESCLAAFEIFERTGFTSFHESWNELDLLYGREIEFQQGDEVFRGRGAGVDSQGKILLQVGGQSMSFAAGQILKFKK